MMFRKAMRFITRSLFPDVGCSVLVNTDIPMNLGLPNGVARSAFFNFFFLSFFVLGMFYEYITVGMSQRSRRLLC